MFISHESASKSSLLNYLRTLSYLSPSLENLIHQWFGSWGSWRKKYVAYFGNCYLNLCFLLHESLLLLGHVLPKQADSR